MDEIEAVIMESIDKIKQVSKNALPEITSKLVKKVFNEPGNNGRDWDPNKSSTIKRKKSSDPNIETGLLELTLTEPGFIIEDDYMNRLPIPLRSNSSDGYLYANDMREFDNLGRTEQDEQYIETKLEEILSNDFN